VHTLSPVIAATAERIYAIATPAADGQVQTITQVLDHMFGVGDSPPDALDRPRWRSCDRMLLLEDGFDREIASELLARDHEISWLPARDHSFGSVATAGYDWPTGTVFASADLRRETTAGVR
jgi:gamma-glutamyltranspeptidase/glutathione hydrolase